MDRTELVQYAQSIYWRTFDTQHRAFFQRLTVKSLQNQAILHEKKDSALML